MKKEVKKEKKQNIYIEKFKSIWAVPRYKSLIKLGAYLLFFTLVFTCIDFKSTDDLPASETSTKATLYTMHNYAYQMNITHLLPSDEPIQTLHITGKTYGTRDTFTVAETGEIYYAEKGIYYIGPNWIETEPVFFDFEAVKPKKIDKYVEKGTLHATTSYADKTTEKKYTLPISTFATLYKNETVPTEGNVTISVITMQGEIVKVTLDLSAYNQTQVEINYTQIGEIKLFDQNSIENSSS